MSEVSIKFFMPMKVASTGKKGPHGEIGTAAEKISQSLQEKKVKHAGATLGLFHDDPKAMDPQKAHYEVCIPISGKLKGEGEVTSKELERGAFACITHTGSIEKLTDSYALILKWIEENGYKISGSTREIYHKGVAEKGANLQDCIIEVQFPVRK
jgi:AraC family transcriptional regulator